MSDQHYDPVELAQTIFEHSTDALFLFDIETEKIVDANPAALRLSSTTLEGVRRATLTDVFREEATNQPRAFRTLGSFQARVGFQMCQCDTAAWIPVSVAVTHLRGQSPHLGLLTARDLRASQTAGAQNGLMESRQRFEALLNMVPMLGFIVDSEGRLIYVNHALVSKFERPAEYFLGKTALELYPPDVAQMLQQHNREALTATQPVEMREIVPTPDGVVREWWTVRVPFHDAHGRALLGCLALDLTERRQLEEALRRSEERYRSLWERNLAGIVRATLDGRILDCNDSFARLFGFGSRAEVLAHSTKELYFDPGVRAEFVARLRASGQLTNYEMLMRRADGSSIWVLEHVSLLVENGEEILEGTLIDISDRKRIEEALRASEATYRTLISHLDQAIFLKDHALRYLTANSVFCASVGKSEDELRGKTISELFDAGPLVDKSREIEKRVLLEGRTIESEELITVYEKTRTVRIHRTPVKDPDGTIVGVLGICWDVTEQRALEAQVRHVHKMDAIGQLAGGIAHDFNNLLTIMLGNLSFALNEGVDVSTILEMVRNAEKAGLRAAELTKTLLGFSRRAALATVPCDLHQIIDEVLTLTRPALAAKIIVEVQRQSAAWLAQADPGLIHQVLTNLTFNARDAMPQGGTLVFEVSHFVPDADYLATHVEARAGDFVRLRVKDTGEGIAADVKQRIFEPFFTTKEKSKGTGLGLAIAFSIIKQHAGWIVCDSEPGRGATFDLFLPRAPASVTAVTLPARAAGPSAGAPLILLVDDERMIRELTKTILTRAGFEVIAAENGETAAAIFSARRAEIVLVILDAVMPRLSGRDTLRLLSGIDARVPVLFSSGYSNEEVDVNEFPQVRGFLTKPFRAEHLVQWVNEIVRPAPISPS